MNNTISIRVEKEDYDSMMNECINEFLREYPHMKGLKLTTRFMFKRLVNFYLGKPQDD